MNPVIHEAQTASPVALSYLGLTENPLLAAVRQGYLARANCTLNHPPLFASFVAWGGDGPCAP